MLTDDDDAVHDSLLKKLLSLHDGACLESSVEKTRISWLQLKMALIRMKHSRNHKKGRLRH